MIDELINKNIIQEGKFTLKSGETSNIYINLKKVISYPQLHLKLCSEIIKTVNPNNDLICGTPYGAVSFTSYISISGNIPMIFLRKEQKDYGTNKLIEGEFIEGQTVTLIEDVTTTGNSVIESARKLEEHGLIISQIITIFSRSDNKHLMYRDIPIEYLYHIDDIQGDKTVTDIMKEKKTNICLAADVTTIEELLKLIKLVGKHICILKVHSDIILDFYKDYEYNKDLFNKSKKKYNFKIWEDRKLADIGYIMNKQVHAYISEWADIISVHPIAGMKSLSAIKDIDIILIGEMSSEDHLMNTSYQEEVIKISEQSDNIIGIVCQHKMSDRLLNIVPGISFDRVNDQQGQKYSTPKDKDFADIYVIGRDIYESDDPKTSILNYLYDLYD